MTRVALYFLLIMAGLVVSALGSKLLWDEYQMDRAMEQSPKVVERLDQIRLFPGSSRIPSKYEGPSVNEYATSTWRDYLAEAKCADVQAHLEKEASRNGFELESIEPYMGGTQIFYRQGEYGMRARFEPQNNTTCDYAVSVNWGAST